MPNDISTTPPSRNPPSSQKPITIDILKTGAQQDLRSVFLALGDALNIKTADFYYKLGDLMISNQTFSTTTFATRFLNLITQYSNGVVYEGIAGGSKLPFDLSNPDPASIKKAAAFATYVASTGSSTVAEKDGVPFNDPDPNGRTKASETIVSITSKDSKDVTVPVDIGPDIDKIVENILAKANRTGTTNNIDIFLYNTIPYIAGGALSGAATATGQIVSSATGKSNILNPNLSKMTTADLMGNLVGAGTSIVNGLVNPFIYFTPEELVYLTIANFYTIMIRRGITIKDLSLGVGVIFDPALGFLKPNVIEASTKAGSKVYDIDTINYYTKMDRSRDEKPVDIKAEIDDYLNKSNDIKQDNIERSKTNIDIDLTNPRIQFSTEWEDSDGVTGKSGLDALESVVAKYKGLNSIGCVYIWPVDSDIAAPSIIPFEFNPSISESGVDVKYQSMSILSRVGDLQSYTSTGSLNVTITAPYFALSEVTDESGDNLQYLSYFSLKNLQNIELGYRSLTLPFFSDQSSVETGYRYVRPPLIKIIMGDYNSVDDETDPFTAPFSNLLRYPSAVIGSSFSGLQGIKFRSYRTFICTSVKIGKELDNTPIYIKNKMIKDTMGFTVELSLVEVAPSYVEALPSFANFYNNAYLTRV